MNKQEAIKLQVDDCVLVPAFVRMPSCDGKADGGSVIGKFGEVELSAPSRVGNTSLWVLPEQIVGRCPAREGLKVGDVVQCASAVACGVGFVVAGDSGSVLVRLKDNCLLHWFRRDKVSLLISVEELQDRAERARVVAAKKRAYAKGGLPELEKLVAEQNKEGGEA